MNEYGLFGAGLHVQGRVGDDNPKVAPIRHDEANRRVFGISEQDRTIGECAFAIEGALK